MARIHALWGLGQIGRHGAKFAGLLDPIIPLLSDADAEVRAQTAKVLGDAHVSNSLDGLIKSLTDSNLRVRFFAAQSLGKLGDPKAVQPLLAMLAENADRDPFLRHGGVMGLVGSAGKSDLVRAAGESSSGARMGVLLAMRRLQLAEVAMFLHDPDPLIVIEAARAINDVPIVGAVRNWRRCIGRPAKSSKCFTGGSSTRTSGLETQPTQLPWPLTPLKAKGQRRCVAKPCMRCKRGPNHPSATASRDCGVLWPRATESPRWMRLDRC